MRSMSSSAAAMLVTAAALTASACTTPEGDASMYRDEALSTLSAAQSSVVTVQIVLTTRLRDRIFGRAADDAVSTAETSLSSTAGTFEGLQPPRRADAVRRQATQLLSDAEDAVAAARIAVRRDDRSQMRQALVAVAHVADQLEQAPETVP
jgi:hypothetical protein